MEYSTARRASAADDKSMAGIGEWFGSTGWLIGEAVERCPSSNWTGMDFRTLGAAFFFIMSLVSVCRPFWQYTLPCCVQKYVLLYKQPKSTYFLYGILPMLVERLSDGHLSHGASCGVVRRRVCVAMAHLQPVRRFLSPCETHEMTALLRCSIYMEHLSHVYGTLVSCIWNSLYNASYYVARGYGRKDLTVHPMPSSGRPCP